MCKAFALLSLLMLGNGCEMCGCQERIRVEKTEQGTVIGHPAQEGEPLAVDIKAPASSNVSLCIC